MRGRPKKPAGKAKDYMLRVRMTHAERDVLDAAARLKSLQLSSWVRSEMLALARRLLARGAR